MANIEVILPRLGEGVIEATITRWLAAPDTQVVEEEPIVEIATDKVDSEVPAPASGILVTCFFAEGETPKVGDVIAVIKTNGELPGASSDAEKRIKVTMQPEIEPEPEVEEEPVLIFTASNKTSPLISPFIRHYAKQRGISLDELCRIKGTGLNQVVTKKDVLNYFKTYKPVVYPAAPAFDGSAADNRTAEIPYTPKEGEQVVPLNKNRKLIAAHMVRSVHEAPHVTSFVEADVTQMVLWREQNKKRFLEENKVNLTYTPILTEIVVKALKEFPLINVTLYGDKLIIKNYIHIGIATALPDNNLIVPVVRNADKKNLASLASDIADLTRRARSYSLKPGETNGGTFTITNLGQVGNVSGTPIINQPESAILAVGSIVKKPWAVTTDEGYAVGIRDVITLSLSYDHRVIDGVLGGSFLSRIGQLLESYIPVF